VLWDTEVKEVVGVEQGFTKALDGAILFNNKTGKEFKIDIEGFFVAIGHKPNSDLFKGKLEMDETGYLITKPDSTATSVDGIFAAGDIQDKHFRQAITAAGTGCMSAIESERFLGEQV
jgi:thioredoxin reductase (NADPH)